MVLAIAKTGIYGTPRKRPSLSPNTRFASLDGVLELPARFVIEDHRPVFQRDLAQNPDHDVQVFDGIERQQVVAAGYEPLWTPAILGWTAAAAPGAAWIELVRLRRQVGLDSDLVSPRDLQVVLVNS
jgi:hypothetical protein